MGMDLAVNYIEAEPLEFNDFSGGLTDHILQGDPKRYARADNYLITVDKKLEVRYGTNIFDPTGYTLPGASGRVNGLYTFINESILLAQADRNFYVHENGYNSAWVAITGPTGNEPVSGGGNFNQITTGEFQRQFYFASDALVQPGKLIRDENNLWKALSPGIPRISWVPTYATDSQLLSACVRLANDIRQSMLAHFVDAASSTAMNSTNQHGKVDTVSQATINAAAVATSQATLYTLCTALGTGYETHRADLGTTGSSYHMHMRIKQNIALTQGTTPTRPAINQRLTLSGTVTSLTKAAAFLDELAQKWYWHQLAPLSHSPTNDYATMSRHLVTVPKVGTPYQSPYTMQVSVNYGDFCAFAVWMKNTYNYHVGNSIVAGNFTGPYHSQRDTQGWATVTLPDPSDFDSAALTIFWCRYCYGAVHQKDSVLSFSRITYDTSAGTADLTNVKHTIDSSAATMTVGLWFVADWGTPIFDDADGDSVYAARVIASGSGTATLSKNALATNTAAVGGYGGASGLQTMWWHLYYDGGLGFIADSATSKAASGELLNAVTDVGTNMASWVDLGYEFLVSLATHEANQNTHFQGFAITNDLQSNSSVNGNPFFVPVPVYTAWGAFYRYQYTVERNGIIYLSEGTPTYSLSTEVCPSYPIGTVIASPNTNFFPSCTIAQENASATIKNIPTLANTSLTNYDTVTSVVPIPDTGFAPDLTIELYRTTGGGSTFYYLDSLTNGTTSYSDVTNDTLNDPGKDPLNTQKTIYTSGGVVANDIPPTCKYIHEFGGVMYYGSIIDSGQYFPQRIRQSLAGAPDSAPLTFFDDLEDELAGISSTRSNVIALCKNSLYRMSGTFDSTGGGGLTHDRILDAMGCISARSIVKTEIGIFYAGNDGFYYTDGYQAIKISLDLDKTYRAHTTSDAQRESLVGCYDKLTRRVWWGMSSQPTNADNDVAFIYYLDYGVKPSGVFTKALTTVSWKPAAIVFYKGELVIGDTRGYLLQTDKYTKTDPKISTDSPSTWATAYIPWHYLSCSLDFGTIHKRKWVTRIHNVGENVGNAAIQVNSINDMGTAPNGSSTSSPLAPIQYNANFVWGDPKFVWNTTPATCAWKYDGKMDVWRRFPAGSMRSDFKQVEFVPGNFVVYRSDDYPTGCTANCSASTAVIATPAGYTAITWPLDPVDMYLSLSTDSYAAQFLITAISSDKLTLTVSGTIPTDAAAKWQIKGVKKNQRMRITAFEVSYNYLGDENEGYLGDTSNSGLGTNA